MAELLYVAGPYTRDDPVLNTHRAIRCAAAIYDAGQWVPVVPHLTLLWQLVDPRPLEFWYAYDLHLLARCDAIVRLPGLSTGADREMDEANLLGLRLVTFAELPDAAMRAWSGDGSRA